MTRGSRASRVNRASRSGSVANESGQDFERDIAIQLGIARAIDLSHSAFADRRGDYRRPRDGCRA